MLIRSIAVSSRRGAHLRPVDPPGRVRRRPKARGRWFGPVAMGALWSLAAFLVLVSVWGGPDKVAFGSPDEALTRRAIEQVVETGSVAVEPPIPDPEGVFAQRLWASYEGRAIPTHTPFLFYLYAAPERLVDGGRWVVLVLPSLGLGAFVTAIGGLLPRRRWLALFAPGLAFPFTFRFLKPWENMAAMSSLMAIAFMLWVVWYRTGKRGWIYASLAVTTLAASVRPDQVHVVLGLSLLWTALSTRGRERRWLVLLHGVAGFVVVLGVLVENAVVTGDPFLPPVYLLQGEPGTEIAGKDLPPGISQAVSLLLPKGIPDWSNVVFQSRKYWWDLGPIRWVTIGAGLASVVLVVTSIVKRRYVALASGVATVGILALYYLSRINRTDWGASSLDPSIGHSLPRYSAIVYGAAAVVLLYGVSRLPRITPFAVASVATALVSIAGLTYLYDGEVRTSLKDSVPLLQAYEGYAEALDRQAHANAVFYVRFTDKFVWSVRPTAVVPTEPGVEKKTIRYTSLLDSVDRALRAGFRPYVFELRPDEVEALGARLRERGLELVEWNPRYSEDVTSLLVRWSVWEVRSRG